MASEDLKKQDHDDDNDNISSFKKVPTNSNAKPHSKVPKPKKPLKQESESVPRSTSSSRSKASIVKMLLEEDNSDDDDKPIAKKITNTKVVKEVKKKKVKKEEEVVVTEKKKIKKDEGVVAEKKKVKKEEVVVVVEKKKKDKKVYDLPGQKRDPPEERDPLRVFYETLNGQIPTSEMALIWLMESGLLPKELAMKVYEKKQKKGLQQKITSPVKSVSAVKNSTKSVTVKKKSPTTPNSSVKKKTTNSAAKQSKKRKSESVSSEDDDSDFDIGSAVRKRRKVA